MIEFQYSSCGCAQDTHTVRVKDVQRGLTLTETSWVGDPGPDQQSKIRVWVQQALAEYHLTVPIQWATMWWAAQ